MVAYDAAMAEKDQDDPNYVATSPKIWGEGMPRWTLSLRDITKGRQGVYIVPLRPPVAPGGSHPLLAPAAVESAKKWIGKAWPPEWLAPYHPQIFGSDAFKVNYITRVLHIEEAYRWQLLVTRKMPYWRLPLLLQSIPVTRMHNTIGVFHWRSLVSLMKLSMLSQRPLKATLKLPMPG